MTTTLQPLRHKEEYSAEVERHIVDYFLEAIFGPILAEIMAAGIRPDPDDQGPTSRLTNAGTSAIVAALDEGRIWYANGTFAGRFSAAISKELRQAGATFDKGSATFHLAEARLPDDVKFAASRSQAASKALHESVDNTLKAAAENIAAAPQPLSFGAAIPRIVHDLGHEFKKATDAIEAISVEPDLTPAVVKTIDEQFTQNLTKYIKDFALEQIPDLRQEVADNLFAGGRADRLASIIETRFGLSKRKAAFLASQETSLLVSKYREARYTEIGSDQYKWSTSHDERVRPDHALLNGTIQSWSNPPITNRATGAHNNPGEDFNCFPGDLHVNLLDGVKKAFRRHYSGELTELITESGKTIRATPNHPVLTLRGWKPIGLIDQSDEILEVCPKLLRAFEPNGQHAVSEIGEVFESLRKKGFGSTFPGEREQFHGDGADGDVDVVKPAGGLLIDRKPSREQSLGELILAMTTFLASAFGCFFQHLQPLLAWNGPSARMGSTRQCAALFRAQSRHPDPVGLRSSANRNTSRYEASPDDPSVKPGALGDRQFALPADIGLDDRSRIKLQAICRRSRPKSISTRWFDGHVFNFETHSGWYATENVVVSNCRCVAIPILRLLAKDRAA